MNGKRLTALSLGALLLLGAGAQAVEGPARAAWQDESIYFIMIDRFHNGDPSNDRGANPKDPYTWHGGDLQGIINKLDYIKSLGFTTIWITPHVKNALGDYHGYGAIDYFDTDPHFGTVAKTRELVQKAHSKGIKVIFDIVVNHTGPENPLVKERPDWFHPKAKIYNWEDEKQLTEGWIFDLPDFDQSKPEVREYILSYSKFWIEQTGVDGFRIDTVKHVPKEFFAWYGPELQKIKPGFGLIGEHWHSDPKKLAPYQQGGIDAMMDFPASDAARNVFAKDESMQSLAATVQIVGQTMPDPHQMGAFLDNHDMKRFVSFAKDDHVGRLKLGLTWLFTSRSIPILYYGTEVAMQGLDDPYNRNDFPWGKEENLDVRDLVAKLNAIRKSRPALRRGEVTNIFANQTAYAYSRVAGEDKVVVVLNNHATESFSQNLEIAVTGIADGTVLKDLLTGHEAMVVGGVMRPVVAPRTGAIYAVPGGGGELQGWGILAGIIGGLAVLMPHANWLTRRRKQG